MPEPCRPAIRITAGGTTPSSSPTGSSPPSISTRPSWTILTTCSDGLTARITASPVACSLARAMKSRTTGRATSASSRATRTSRRASSTSAADSTPRPVSRSKTPVSLSPRVSNMSLEHPSKRWREPSNAKRPRARSRGRGASPPSSGQTRVVAVEGALLECAEEGGLCARGTAESRKGRRYSPLARLATSIDSMICWEMSFTAPGEWDRNRGVGLVALADGLDGVEILGDQHQLHDLRRGRPPTVFWNCSMEPCRPSMMARR